MTATITDAARATRTHVLQKGFALLALVLVLFGVKLLLIEHFAVPVPFWDQWDAEADILYRSYIGSQLSWSTLFAAHNEHRVLTIRVLSLLLFELNGGWDPILQMIANAALDVAAGVLIVLMAGRILRPAQIVPLALFATFIFVLPFGWENLLVGFQSQHFMMVFSFLALAGFAGAAGLSVGWWLSLACAVAAYFSMASGALTGLAAFFVIILQMILGVRRGAREYLAALMLLAASGLMIVFIPHIAGHDVLRAHGIQELVLAFIKCLDFPTSGSFVGLVTQLPLLIYAWFVIKTRPERKSAHWGVLILIVWWLGQMISFSFGRAAAPDASRYLDVTVVALPLNFAILLFAQDRVAHDKRSWLFAGTALWLAIIAGSAIYRASTSSVPSVIEKSAQSRVQQDKVKTYLKTGDLATLQNQPPLTVPYPLPERLASLLSDPAVRMALPEAIRPAEVDEKSLFDRTLLRGKLHPLVVSLKLWLLQFAPIMVSLGIASAFSAGLAGLRRRERPAAGRSGGLAPR